ncbi:MAG: hypothetical protein AAGA99_01540 [Actinomycetota bacterium]
MALVAVIGLAVIGSDDDAPPAVETESEAVRVLREFVTVAMAGEEGDGEDLVASPRVLEGTDQLSPLNFLRFVRRLSPELQSVECVDIDAETAACIVNYVDDWARAIVGESLTLWTARVEGGLITEFSGLVSNDDALTTAFFADYMPTAQPEAWDGCIGFECLAGLPAQFAADYAASEFFVPRTELTLPEAAG